MRPPRPMGEATSLSGPERRRSRRAAGVAASLVAHLLGLAAMLGLRSPPPRPVEPPPIEVTLVAPPRPPPAPRPPAPKAASKPLAKPPARAARQAAAAPSPTPPQPTRARTVRRVAANAPALPARLAETPDPGPPALTEAELAGAATAGPGSGSGAGSGSGSGSGGGDCDMIRRVQAALRKDGLVRAEVAALSAAGGRGAGPLLVWNGDWVQGRGEDGRGLAAVREAIIWEVGFSPKACRTEPVRGLVMFTLGEGAGAARLVVGQSAWRWSDMLTAKGVMR